MEKNLQLRIIEKEIQYLESDFNQLAEICANGCPENPHGVLMILDTISNRCHLISSMIYAKAKIEQLG